MATQEQGVEFVNGMNEAWNRGDRAGWFSYFADDFAEEMPANSPATKAPDTLVKAWEDSFGPGGAGWHLEARKIVTCGNEVAVIGHYEGTLDGKPFEMDSIDIWTVDDAMKARYCRAFFLS